MSGTRGFTKKVIRAYVEGAIETAESEGVTVRLLFHYGYIYQSEVDTDPGHVLCTVEDAIDPEDDREGLISELMNEVEDRLLDDM